MYTEILTKSGTVYYVDEEHKRVFRKSDVPLEVISYYRTEDEKTGRWRDYIDVQIVEWPNGMSALAVVYTDGTVTQSTAIVSVEEVEDIQGVVEVTDG